MEPILQGAEKHYHDSLKKGCFLIQHCQCCMTHVFYPRMICPHCGSNQLEWIEPTGFGRVYSTTVVKRKEESGGDYNVALISLDEGVRLMSRVEGIAPAAVYIDLRVKALIKSIAEQENEVILVFVPVEENDEL
ncbi:MAG: DNA-binding protein [Alcaligenaceae bacterium]|nr:DNA-binding protein [Alcaligenaceae bacterium]